MKGRVLALMAAMSTVAVLAPPAMAMPPTTFNPVVEAQNFSITQQRQTIYDTPQYQAQLSVDSLNNTTQALAIQAADPGRFFTDDLCWNQGNGCAGDIRLNNWATNGYGIVRPFLFTARNGATISGHVWATVAGPAKRPGIVITNGSVQADEQMYWYAAQTLAKEGYVVLTFDPQGQGQSDTYGQSPDQNEGFPAQSTGTPFYDGTEDAIDFFLSTPSHPYEPVTSCTTGTSHAAKQNQRVAAGLDAAYNPFWSLLDPSELGLAGHSYGAAGVSYIGQWDPRVKAIVAWDDLGGPGPNDAPTPGAAPGAPSQTIGESACPAHPEDRTTVPITKPALGMSADYGLPPAPEHPAARPERQVDLVAQLQQGRSRHGPDHHPRRLAPGLQLHPQPGLRRLAARPGHHRLVHHGLVRQVPQARPGRGRDAADATVARRPGRGGNRSQPRRQRVLVLLLLALGLPPGERPGLRLREPARRLRRPGADEPGRMVRQLLLRQHRHHARQHDGRGTALKSSNGLAACTAHSAVRFSLPRFKHRAITKAVVYVDGRRVLTRKGRALHKVSIPGFAGAGRHRVRVYEYTRKGFARRTTRYVYGCAHKG